MIRIISKKAGGKPATKTAKPTAIKSARKSTLKAKVEAPEVRKADPEMPDALNRLDPKIDAAATTARDNRAEELRRQHSADAEKAKTEADSAKAAKPEPKGKGKSAKSAAGSRKGSNVGSVAKEAILAGASNEDALKAVMKAFPDCHSNLGCMAWYRNKLRRDRLLPKAERGKKAA